MLGLKLVDAIFTVGDALSYFCGLVYASTFSIVTGLENIWCFYENETVPVQKRFTASNRTDDVEWYYYRRTREWVHRNATFGKAPKKCPWMLATVVKQNRDQEDLSEFFASHRFYMPQGYIQWPTAEQMLAAWSIESHQWFIGAKRDTTKMTIMDKDCVDHTFNISLEDEDSLRAYWSTFGMTYSADTSVAPSEESSESEGIVEESEENEEAVENTSEEVPEEAVEESSHEEKPDIEVNSDSEVIAEISDSPPASADRMDEMD